MNNSFTPLSVEYFTLTDLVEKAINYEKHSPQIWEKYKDEILDFVSTCILYLEKTGDYYLYAPALSNTTSDSISYSPADYYIIMHTDKLCVACKSSNTMSYPPGYTADKVLSEYLEIYLPKLIEEF